MQNLNHKIILKTINIWVKRISIEDSGNLKQYFKKCFCVELCHVENQQIKCNIHFLEFEMLQTHWKDEYFQFCFFPSYCPLKASRICISHQNAIFYFCWKSSWSSGKCNFVPYGDFNEGFRKNWYLTNSGAEQCFFSACGFHRSLSSIGANTSKNGEILVESRVLLLGDHRKP